jgi:ribosomal-protein-alanine N-acetyltransferase
VGYSIAGLVASFRIAGPTLSLRLPEPADAPALFALAGDPEVTRWFSWGPYRDVADALAWLASVPGQRERGEELALIAERGDRAIGVYGLNELSRRDRRCMLGYWLGRPFWGTGAHREGVALSAALAFGPMRLGRLGAYTNVENTRSAASLERAGFAREGTLRAWHRHGDAALDVHVFGLLRAEWERSELARIPVEVHGRPPAAFVMSS